MTERVLIFYFIYLLFILLFIYLFIFLVMKSDVHVCDMMYAYRPQGDTARVCARTLARVPMYDFRWHVSSKRRVFRLNNSKRWRTERCEGILPRLA